MAKQVNKVVSADLEGAKALQAALLAFPAKFVKKGIRRVVKTAVKDIILPDAVRNTPVSNAPGRKGGTLKRSIKVATAKNRRGGRMPRHVIGFSVISRAPKGDDAWYAKYVFLNTKNRNGTIRKGTQTLRKALYDNQTMVKHKITTNLRLEVPKIAQEVRIDSLKYKG